MIRNQRDMSVFSTLFVSGTNPGPGNDYSVASPAGHISLLADAQFIFTSDANAANRAIYMACSTVGKTPILCGAQHYITANQIAWFMAHINNSYCSTNNTMFLPLCLPNTPIFEDGDELHITAMNIQAGDTFTALKLWWHCWTTGPP